VIRNSEHEHLRKREIVSFQASSLPAPRQRAILRHLAGECQVCVQRLSRGVPREAKPVSDKSAYVEVVHRALAQATERYRTVAEEIEIGRSLWEELRAIPLGRRLTLVRNSRNYCSAFLLQAILEAYREGGWRQPREGLELGRLAVAVVGRLDFASTSPWLLADLQAEALAVAGNACLTSRLEDAQPLLAEAAAYARRGSDVPLVQALMLSQLGSYELARRRFRPAERYFSRAEQIYRRIGELALAARMLVHRARAIGHLHPGKGVRLTRRALTEMGSERLPRLKLEAVHQLAWCLCEAGNAGEARQVLETHAELYLASGAMASFSRYWLLGRIHRSLQEIAETERYYYRAWAGFSEIDARLELTLLALDIAEVRVAMEDLWGAAEALTDTMVLAQSWGLEREAVCILHLLLRVIAQRGCERVVFRRVGAALWRPWA
jgi:tetratricopeptide (TPR) repeat protein